MTSEQFGNLINARYYLKNKKWVAFVTNTLASGTSLHSLSGTSEGLRPPNGIFRDDIRITLATPPSLGNKCDQQISGLAHMTFVFSFIFPP